MKDFKATTKQLEDQLKELNKIRKDGLNPYCSGQWYRGTVVRNINVTECESLNPYCSGQWYRT